MSAVKKLIEHILASQGREERFSTRLKRYPMLAAHGDLPQTLRDISNDKPPWYCNGLAFRMATYSSENIFARLNDLLALAVNSVGWNREYQNWSSPKDHWAKGWDRFFQFLWQLQCLEYFREDASRVTFPSETKKAAPDLKITMPEGNVFYAECFVYSKWWFVEVFLEELINLIDPNLFIERIHNIPNKNLSRSFSENEREKTLEFFAQALNPENLQTARIEVERAYPYVICQKAGLKIAFRGDGVYQPDVNNAQGDPRLSREIYMREIINAKDGKDQLTNYHPNILMVNGLGPDFQKIFRYDSADSEASDAKDIDSLLIAACGIDEILKNCVRVKRIAMQTS